LDLEQVIAFLKSERDRLDGAIAALEGGSPRATVSSVRPGPKPGAMKGKRRKISAAGLARIRAAQKARWAKARAGK